MLFCCFAWLLNPFSFCVPSSNINFESILWKMFSFEFKTILFFSLFCYSLPAQAIFLIATFSFKLTFGCKALLALFIVACIKPWVSFSTCFSPLFRFECVWNWNDCNKDMAIKISIIKQFDWNLDGYCKKIKGPQNERKRKLVFIELAGLIFFYTSHREKIM